MRGRIHRSAGALDLAKLEYEQSVALDPVNDTALQEFRRLNEEIEQRRLASEGGSAVEKAKRNAQGQTSAFGFANDVEVGLGFNWARALQTFSR